MVNKVLDCQIQKLAATGSTTWKNFRPQAHLIRGGYASKFFKMQLLRNHLPHLNSMKRMCVFGKKWYSLTRSWVNAALNAIFHLNFTAIYILEIVIKLLFSIFGYIICYYKRSVLIHCKIKDQPAIIRTCYIQTYHWNLQWLRIMLYNSSYHIFPPSLYLLDFDSSFRLIYFTNIHKSVLRSKWWRL